MAAPTALPGALAPRQDDVVKSPALQYFRFLLLVAKGCKGRAQLETACAARACGGCSDGLHCMVRVRSHLDAVAQESVRCMACSRVRCQCERCSGIPGMQRDACRVRSPVLGKAWPPSALCPRTAARRSSWVPCRGQQFLSRTTLTCLLVSWSLFSLQSRGELASSGLDAV
jgi:hypothetical protein